MGYRYHLTPILSMTPILDGASTIKMLYRVDGKVYEGGFEMNTGHSHGIHSGRSWVIRVFY